MMNQKLYYNRLCYKAVQDVYIVLYEEQGIHWLWHGPMFWGNCGAACECFFPFVIQIGHVNGAEHEKSFSIQVTSQS